MLTRPNAEDIRNVVYQQVIDKEEINDAFKMAEEDLERERAGSPCFENDGTPRQPRRRSSLDLGSAQGPSTSKTNTGTRRRRAASPQGPQPPFAIPNKFTSYGGTTPNGQQFYGSAEALNGYCMLKKMPDDGNCFFQ